MAKWIEKKPIGDSRVPEDGNVTHSRVFRSDAGSGLAESVTQGFVLGGTETIAGKTLTIIGKRTAQDGVFEDVFIDYGAVAGFSGGKKLPPEGTIVRSMVHRSTSVDCEIARVKGTANVSAAAVAAKARGEANLTVDVTDFVVAKTIAWSWSETSISTEVGMAATPAAYLSGSVTSWRWEVSGISVDATEGRATVTMTWTYRNWRGSA